MNSNSKTPGIPAIVPHLATIPSFTEDDVYQYFVTNGFMMGKIILRNPPAIESITFVDREKLRQVVGIGLASTSQAGQLFCYVQLAGEFVVFNPLGGSLTFTKGYILFDAQSGNRLGVGTLGVGKE